jgi:hypothetical protein
MSIYVSNVLKFRIEPRNAPPRSPYLSPHQMLCTLFADETPMMDFLKDIYQAHRIVTVRDWDHFGGARLFDAFQLDNASRKEFNEMIGAPYRPNFAQAAPVVALRPER